MKPVTLDGWIYIVLAVCTAMAATFSSDEAAHYVIPLLLFVLKSITSWTAAGALALKLYRSTAFADYKTAMNGNYQKQNEPKLKTGNTEIITKTNETKIS